LGFVPGWKDTQIEEALRSLPILRDTKQRAGSTIELYQWGDKNRDSYRNAAMLYRVGKVNEPGG
jgi:hypothetical protein